MNHTDLYKETYAKWAEKTPKTDDAIKRRSEILQTLEWMKENEYHFTKVRTGKGVRWNLFDCRDCDRIKFLATFRTLSGLVKHVRTSGPFG